MAGSILTEIKESLGLAADQTSFDGEIRMFINTALADAAQLGVGPLEGVEVRSTSTKWTELTDDDPLLNAVKGYIHLRVKMFFDPPDTGYVLTAMQEQIEKAEWRIMVAADPPAVASVTDPLLTGEDGFRREYITDYGD